MPRLSVPLTTDQHAAIRRKAGAIGVPQAEVARRLLLAWARGELAMPHYEEGPYSAPAIESIRGENHG